MPLFQSVFQAMLLGFTPLFGNNNLPEIDLRLAVHVLTWIYDRHTEDVAPCMETLKVIEVIHPPEEGILIMCLGSTCFLTGFIIHDI